MAYIDKIFYHDENDRKIELLNHKDGWTGGKNKSWDFDHISVRKRATDSACEENVGISIEAWYYDDGSRTSDNDMVELILSQKGARELAHKLLMSIAEIDVENILWSTEKKVSEIESKLEWLEPLIEEKRDDFFQKIRKNNSEKGEK